MNEDVSPIKNGAFPAGHVSLLEGIVWVCGHIPFSTEASLEEGKIIQISSSLIPRLPPQKIPSFRFGRAKPFVFFFGDPRLSSSQRFLDA